MRIRLIMKVVTLAVGLAVTIVAAHSCSGGSSPSSPLNPTNLARNGLSGLCANQQAVASAAGDNSAGAGTIQLSPSDSALAGIAGLSRGAFTCPTTTVAGAGG